LGNDVIIHKNNSHQPQIPILERIFIHSMSSYLKNLLITGGAGFIGSHVVRLFVNKYPQYRIINFDKLTYAGNLTNLKDIDSKENYVFVKGDINDVDAVNNVFNEFEIDSVIHLAAESHVDRSISNPIEFVMTNVIGTANLLNAAKAFWKEPVMGKNLFYHVSTDEVYGSLGATGFFTEKTPYDPHSPYSASKASSDHLVRAYFDTYKLPVVISNCSNNYGSYQFPEKLIPLAINNIKNNQPVPVYGKGENIRDWLYVEDHARAIEIIFHNAPQGETYNIGGNNEWKNIDLIMLLCTIMDHKLRREPGSSAKLITYVKDRAGHDLRYAIDSSKIQKELGWSPSLQFAEGLENTVDWYLHHEDWVKELISGEYLKYYEHQYVNR
jgi:dTDP-glucose 4,6-dehydratase